MAYVTIQTGLFAKQWKHLCKKDKPLELKLTEAMKDIAEHPENFDSPLKADRVHSVKKKVARERYRIVYRYCERCIQLHRQTCSMCTMAERCTNTIIFEEVFHRDDGY
jgi:hypothetical protein